MKGSVLIIGSLLWDKNQLREDWRNNYLDINNKKSVSAPIRYGRLSGKRGTYTMVLSSRCLTKKRMGKGVLVPLRLDKYSALDQCEELIKAEHLNLNGYRNRFNYGFFAVGLLPNPQTRNKDLDDLIRVWSSRFEGGFKNNQYRIDQESPIINAQGFLSIPWSKEFNDNDFIVCTAIKPNLSKYPNPKKIAKFMKKKSDFEYFCENQKYGITTFQDDQIKAYLS